MRKRDKRAALQAHARIRHLQRYGEAFTAEDRARCIKAVRKGEATFLERQSLRVTKWSWCGKVFIYDRKRSEIVTFLPPE